LNVQHAHKKETPCFKVQAWILRTEDDFKYRCTEKKIILKYISHKLDGKTCSGFLKGSDDGV
jgi:hypothetical protein